MNEEVSLQRIDKWLWHARFLKTRSLAQKLVKSGGVRVDREKISSTSRMVRAGNVLTLNLARKIMVVEIIDIAPRRGPYSEACLLYRDLTPVSAEIGSGTSGKTDLKMQRQGRPDKQKRREAIRLKQNFPDNN